MIQTRTSQQYYELVQLATPEGHVPATAIIEMIALQQDEKMCWHVLVTLKKEGENTPQILHSSYYQAHELARANNRIQLYKYLFAKSKDLRITQI